MYTEHRRAPDMHIGECMRSNDSTGMNQFDQREFNFIVIYVHEKFRVSDITIKWYKTSGDTTTTNGSDKMLSTVATTVLSVLHSTYHKLNML